MKVSMGLTAAVLAVLLGGCLSKMENVAEDTKAAVNRSVGVIEETRDGQKLGEALNLLPEDIAMKSAAAETMFVYAADNRIYKYIGATMPLNYYMGMTGDLPNVSFVGTEGDSTKNLAPISPEKYIILEIATMRVLREMAGRSQMPIPEEELADIKGKAKKMFLIGTAVLGAMPGPVAHEEDRAVVEKALSKQRANQDEAAKLLLALANLFDDDTRFKVKNLIEVRFYHNTAGISPRSVL